jgi:hypothetical protein
MIFLQGFIKFDHGISEKCVGQTFDGRKKERKNNNNKKKKKKKKRSKHNMSSKLCLGAIIIYSGSRTNEIKGHAHTGI